MIKKIVFFSSLLYLFFSCSENKMIKNQKDSTKVEESIMNDSEELIQKRNKYNWLIELYNDTIEDMYYYDFGFNYSILDNSFNQINDSVSYCIIEVSSGVCLEEYLVTQLFKKQNSIQKIGENCDSDMSIPSYEWTNYKIINDTLYSLTNYREYIPDSCLTKTGSIPINSSIEEFELKLDSTISEIHILSTGDLVNRN